VNEFLKNCPDPTLRQINRWKRARLLLVVLFLCGEILIAMIIYKIGMKPVLYWLEAPSDWLLKHVPAARGHSNATYNYRNLMPYIFSISFLYVFIFASVFAVFNRNKLIINGIINALNNKNNNLIVVFASYLGWWLLVYFYMYGFWVPPDQDPTDDGPFGRRTESAFGLLLWLPTFVIVCGPFLGAHGSFAYDLVRCFLFSGKSRRS
jgi:hypothetical protein